MKMTCRDVEQLAILLGHAINANNGRCELIERALCEATSLCVQVLADMENEPHPELIPQSLRDAGIKVEEIWQ